MEIAQAAPFALTRVRGWIIVAIVLVLQSGMAVFWFDRGTIATPPSVIVMLAIAMIALLLLSGQPVLPAPGVLWWAAGYFTVTVIGYFRSTDSPTAIEALGLRLASLVLLVAVAGLARGSSVQTAARWALVATTLLGVALNCVDAVRPLTFSQDLGRSAGFYRNANIAARALTLSALLALPVVPKRWRASFVVAAVVGVALTLSRGGLLILALGVSLAMIRGVVSAPRVFRSAVIWGAVAVLILWVTGVGERILEALSLLTSGKYGWVRLLTDRDDSSLVARTVVAREAWGLLADHPWLGAGLGATIEWQHEASTHNIYLRLAAEYGIIGLAMMPWLLAVVAKRRTMPFQYTVPAFVVALGVSGLFSHNLLDEWSTLVSVGIAAGSPNEEAEPV